MQMFFTGFVLRIFRLFKLKSLKTEGQTDIQKSSLQIYKTQMKIFAYPGLG